ncbi:MAG: hypothetical protein IJV00_01210 [Clostridia bacterium]|nr:hypothetical protein [Clostridia bacterium]
MEVKAYKYADAREDCVSEWYSKRYRDREVLVLIETKTTQSKSDYQDGKTERISFDNGRTWSAWEKVFDASGEKMKQGEHELNPSFGYGGTVWDPAHSHFVTLTNQYVWIGGYKNVAKKLWKEGDGRYLASHAYITVSGENGEIYKEMIRYQDGDEFDPGDWAKPSYAFRNYALAFDPVIDPESGDLLFAFEAHMRTCCEMLGRDILDYYPYRPDYPHGIIVARGKWDGKRYVFTFGTPIVISDLLSSRGLEEAALAVLSGGRIVVIMRGSNVKMSWEQRLEPGAPGFKWYSYSDDGAKTFTECLPWRFDDGEAVCSSATYSRIFFDSRTKKHYWIGNVTGHKAYGNFPRYPLNIVEIDEKYGTAKKDTLSVIDTRRDGEPETVQLSNFSLFFDRETEKLEVSLSKIGQFTDDLYSEKVFKSEAWRYEITLS